MALSDLIPWSRQRGVPVTRFGEDSDPFHLLHREMNRMFDEFSRGFGLSGAGTGLSGIWPTLDVSETDKEFRISAELPGLEEKDVEVSLQDGVLTLKGERKVENDGALYSERYQGRFQRSIQLGPDADPDKTRAAFRNGLLTITVAKRDSAGNGAKRIPITH